MPKLTTDDLQTFERFRAWIQTHAPADAIDLDLSSIDAHLLEWAFDLIEQVTDIDSAKRSLLEWALEACNCANAHAPTGVIDSRAIGKFADWWNEIDTCMREHRDAKGFWFAPETCAHIVWFAVEWRANQLAAMLRSLFENDDHDAPRPNDDSVH